MQESDASSPICFKKSSLIKVENNNSSTSSLLPNQNGAVIQKILEDYALRRGYPLAMVASTSKLSSSNDKLESRKIFECVRHVKTEESIQQNKLPELQGFIALKEANLYSNAETILAKYSTSFDRFCHFCEKLELDFGGFEPILLDQAVLSVLLIDLVQCGHSAVAKLLAKRCASLVSTVISHEQKEGNFLAVLSNLFKVLESGEWSNEMFQEFKASIGENRIEVSRKVWDYLFSFVKRERSLILFKALEQVLTIYDNSEFSKSTSNPSEMGFQPENEGDDNCDGIYHFGAGLAEHDQAACVNGLICNDPMKFRAEKSWIPDVLLYQVERSESWGVTCARFSAEGDFLALGSENSALKIWRLKPNAPLGDRVPLKPIMHLGPPPTPTKLKSPLISHVHEKCDVLTLRGHSGAVYDAKFPEFPGALNSSLVEHVLTCSEDGSARLFNLRTGQNVVIYEGHQGPIWSSDIERNCRFFVTASLDFSAKLFSFEHLYPLRVFSGHFASVDCIRLSEVCENLLATGSMDGSVRLWDMRSAAPVRVCAGFRGAPRTLEFSGAGCQVVYCGGEDRTIWGWDVGSARVLQKLEGHEDTVECLRVLSQNQLISGDLGGSVKVWMLENGKELTCYGALRCRTKLVDFKLQGKGKKYILAAGLS